MNRQLVLSIQQHYQASLNDFCWGTNSLLQKSINSLLESTINFLYVWSETGHGKSHLLQACCQKASQANLSCAYLPLSFLQDYGPSSLESMENLNFIALDNVDIIAGNPAWEEAIFHLFNKLRDNRSLLLIASQFSPLKTPIQLPDLQSRLAWGLSFYLEELCDDEKVNVLQNQAKKRGFELNESIALFLIKRCSRNMHNLIEILDKLDAASLVAKRKLTIPFVKEVLAI